MRNSKRTKIALLGVMAILLYAAIAIAVIGGTGGFDRETAPSSTPIVIPTISPTPTPSPTPTNEPGVVYVTNEKLCDDYNSNQVDADIKYKGRILEVSSTVDGVGRDVLYGGKAFLRMNCGLITDVWCYFDKAYESQLVSVYEGDSVSVRGICTGKNLLSKRIVLHPCTSVKFLISE